MEGRCCIELEKSGRTACEHCREAISKDIRKIGKERLLLGLTIPGQDHSTPINFMCKL